jgi:glycerophosphoryl diester phosphodiesterase
MILLSHRGNRIGIDHSTENSLPSIKQSLQLGFGIETDIRRNSCGNFYISHDPTPWDAENDATTHAMIWSEAPQSEIALNVKELGYENELIHFIHLHHLEDRLFLFDFELLEARPGETATKIHAIAPTIRLAARVSDRYGESIRQAASITAASIIWLDEFDSLWVTSREIARLRQLDRTIYAISPEIHGFSIEETEMRWRQFQDWGVHGICTDYPIRAREILGI